MLKIFLRHYQILDEHGDPIYYDGSDPNHLQTFAGKVSKDQFRDYTEWTEGYDKLNITWRRNEDTENSGMSNIETGVSSTFTFSGPAYEFIKEWLNDHVAAALNSIECRIEDVGCGVLSDFLIKNDGLQYCDDGYCTIDVNLKQKNDQYVCIKNTMITDNWQGWFPDNGRPENKKHPRFAYCNEFRPAFLLGILMGIILLAAIPMYILSVTVAPVLYVILTIIDWIPFTGKKIHRLREMMKGLIGFGPVTHFLRELFENLVGCGREHPAPLIRDYIANVCKKCGVIYSKETIPIFFDQNSDYYNACYFFPEVKKGIKNDSKDRYWIPDNDPLLTLDMLLDNLKPVFNAKWSLQNKTLYFMRKDKFEYDETVFDFTVGDKSKLAGPICYTWNVKKKNAYANAGYYADPFDQVGNDAHARFNDYVEFNKPINPVLEGELNKKVRFGAARFRFDGVDTDYVEDAVQAMNANPLSNLVNALANITKDLDGSAGTIVMQSHICTMPKLLIWNGVSYKGAKVIGKYGWDHNFPPPNPNYNLALNYYPSLYKDDVGTSDYYKIKSKLYNYPMVFDAMFLGNLWDRFHQIDDPRIHPPMNKTFTLVMELCCEDMERLGILNEASNIKIGSKIKLKDEGFYKFGRITDIELNYDPTAKEGRYIQIKGTL